MFWAHHSTVVCKHFPWGSAAVVVKHCWTKTPRSSTRAVPSPARPSHSFIWQGVELDAHAKHNEYSATQASVCENLNVLWVFCKHPPPVWITHTHNKMRRYFDLCVSATGFNRYCCRNSRLSTEALFIIKDLNGGTLPGGDLQGR